MRSTTTLMYCLLAGALAACDAGSVAGPDDTGDTTGDGSGPAGAPLPQVPTPLCEAQLSITGTFTQSQAPPADLAGGCWPLGTWALQVQVADPGGCAEVGAGTQYSYNVTRDGSGRWQVAYQGGGGTASLLSVKAASGECQGSFEHMSEDRRQVVSLHPSLPDGSSAIAGSGTYSEHNSPQ